MLRQASRIVGWTAGLVGWSMLILMGTVVILMSAAHSNTGEWPVGATVSLVVLGTVWVLAPVLMWRRWRGRY